MIRVPVIDTFVREQEDQLNADYAEYQDKLKVLRAVPEKLKPAAQQEVAKARDVMNKQQYAVEILRQLQRELDG